VRHSFVASSLSLSLSPFDWRSDNEEYVGTAGFKGRGKHAGARRKKGGDAAGDVGAGEVAAGVAGISVAGSEGGAAEDGADSDSDLDSEEEAKLLYDNEEYTGSHPHLAKKKGVRRTKKKAAAAAAAATAAGPPPAQAERKLSADC